LRHRGDIYAVWHGFLLTHPEPGRERRDRRGLGAYLLMFPRARVNLFVWPLSVLLANFTTSP